MFTLEARTPTSALPEALLQHTSREGVHAVVHVVEMIMIMMMTKMRPHRRDVHPPAAQFALEGKEALFAVKEAL